MAASARQSARVQLNVDVSALIQTEERRRAVKAALDEAKATARRARAEIDALQPELDTLVKKSARLERNVRDQRGIVVRCILDAFPLELLRAIFLEQCRQPDSLWRDGHQGSYNLSRALVPFTLSAVCRRWRSLALDTAELWTYVGVPAIDTAGSKVGKQLYRYVKDVLERSKSRPVDVMLDWCSSSLSRWDGSPFFHNIFDLLAAHTARWKRFQVQLPRGVTKRLGAFRLPTPVLEELDVLCCGDDNPRWTSRPPTYLPYCPLLRRLTAHRIFVVAREPMLALTYLSINAVSVPIDAVEELLRMTPFLETLRIWFPTEQTQHIVVPPPITLPELSSLDMEGDLRFFPAWATGLQTPKLRHLRIDTLDTSPLSQYLQSSDLRLETIHLVCRYDDCRLSTTAATDLSHLSHLQRLVLQDCEHVHAAFFSTLVPPSLPALNVLQLRGVTLKDDIAEALVQFVRARKQHLSEETTTNARAPLKIELVDAKVPSWLAPQLSTVAVECAVLDDDSSDSSGSSDSESSSLSDDDSDSSSN